MPLPSGIRLTSEGAFLTTDTLAAKFKSLQKFTGKTNMADVMDEMQKIQMGVLKKMMGEGRFNELFTNKDIPEKLSDIVNNKVTYIAALLKESGAISEQIRAFNSINYQIDREGIKTLNVAMMKPNTLGSFLESEMLFRVHPEASVGVNEPLPDIKRIETELKTQIIERVNDKNVVNYGYGLGGLTSGTLQVEVSANDADTVDKAYEILSRLAMQKSLIVFQMYIKMRNLLYIQTRTSKLSETSMRISFVGIILFIEIIIAKIKEWVENWQKQNAEPRVSIGLAKTEQEDFKDQRYTKLTVPGQRSATKSFSSFEEHPGQLIYRMRYEIKLEKLLDKGDTNATATSAGIKEIGNKIIKNIQELYVTRVDILSEITGEGKGEEATSFMTFLRDADVPAIDFTGRQPLIRHLH